MREITLKLIAIENRGHFLIVFLVGLVIQGQTGSYFSASGHFDLKYLKRDYVY